MGLRIGTNIAALAARNQLGKNSERAEHAIRALSSGKRIVQASDDAAGFAISENLRGHLRGIEQAERNTENAISFIQVAEGGLNEQNNILIRMRELGVQAASDTVSDVERSFVDSEFQLLIQEFERIAQTTTYGTKKLLVGNGEKFEFQVGSNSGDENKISLSLTADSRASSAGISGLSIADDGSALDSLENIDQALSQVAGMRAEFGAYQSRMQMAANHLRTMNENIAQAYSNYADADVAFETSELAQANILNDIGISVLAQANSTAARAHQLLL